MSGSDRSNPPLVVIGASSGGVPALLQLAGQLRPDFDAAILIVLHIDAYDGQMPTLMGRCGPLPASYATEGGSIGRGRIYFAPPDHHLLVDGDVMHLMQGSKENHARPAIDPLFRSAALTREPGTVIGVVLSGMLDDGAHGLKVVKDAGGIAVVQDPEEAYAPSMPLAALATVAADHVVGIDDLGALLARLVVTPVEHPVIHPSTAAVELQLMRGEGDAFTLLDSIGTPSSLTCPDCGGSLWALKERPPTRYRCHTGHSFTLRALEHAQSELASTSMWATLRTLNEKYLLLNELAEGYVGEGNEDAVATARELAARVQRASTALRSLLEALPGSAATLLPAVNV